MVLPILTLLAVSASACRNHRAATVRNGTCVCQGETMTVAGSRIDFDIQAVFGNGVQAPLKISAGDHEVMPNDEIRLGHAPPSNLYAVLYAVLIQSVWTWDGVVIRATDRTTGAVKGYR